MKFTPFHLIASALLFASCDSKDKEQAKAAEERRQDTAKQLNEATKNISETYKLPEVKPERLDWNLPKKAPKEDEPKKE